MVKDLLLLLLVFCFMYGLAGSLIYYFALLFEVTIPFYGNRHSSMTLQPVAPGVSPQVHRHCHHGLGRGRCLLAALLLAAGGRDSAGSGSGGGAVAVLHGPADHRGAPVRAPEELRAESGAGAHYLRQEGAFGVGTPQ